VTSIDLASKYLARTRLDRWKDSPVAWARDCLDVDLAGYQGEVLDALPVQRRVAVKGPHGLGKSFMGSVLVNWFATTRDMMGRDWKIITTASAWRHLEVYLWPEIHKWAGRIDFETLGRAPFSPRTELLDLRLKLTYGAATAVASNQPERIEGAHAEELLYLLDEAKIVPPATWDSIEGAFSNAGPDTADNAYAFAMSTPGAPSGRFYDIHRRAPGYEDWWTRSVTLEEAIASGRISRTWAEQRRLQWGEDSAVYHNRVLGNFHASDEDSVIPLAWLEAAVERWHDWDRAGRPDQGGPYWVGVDVGTVRVGVARSDPAGILASPVATLRRDPAGNQDVRELAELVRDLEAVGVVVGLPQTLRGREGSSAALARQYAELLAAQVDVPVRHVDERLTTVSAQRKLRDGGMRGSKATRAVIDQAAAVELLQQWLEILRSGS
jgi:putative transcription antitermination factor YqgF